MRIIKSALSRWRAAPLLAELFAEIGYEATTMEWCRRAKGISALNYWSAFKAGHSPRATGKFNAELGSIVWIILSP
ncbi:hypothetical protein BDD14_5841 [Edaphobacter modestus]|uniref:Uncharacterized protein n=1 Tax=Edaphobacter modestus TaxID=388466 RepID=A0A4Q7YEE7_9BACT|nr:hypothetical protein BDD14_5841 [Edaphobacter modestus]